LPHAGYIYSGKVAAQTVASINIKDTIVLLGPNHTGLGSVFSIMPRGYWQTPLGNLEIDTRLAELFLKKCHYLEADSIAHLDEHSLEVQLPFFQYFKSDFKIVPLAFKTDNFAALIDVAQSLASVIIDHKLQNSVLFIASSDMSHYESQAIVEKKDALAIKAIIALDEKKLDSVVREFDISMCGVTPTIVLIKIAKLLGAKKGKLILYQTSGQATQDTSSVVGYAGITIG